MGFVITEDGPPTWRIPGKDMSGPGGPRSNKGLIFACWWATSAVTPEPHGVACFQDKEKRPGVSPAVPEVSCFGSSY